MSELFTSAWDWFSRQEPAVAAAIVAGLVSLATTFITLIAAPSLRYAFDKRLENRKLDMQYRFEQRKALKDHIARHRGRFLEAADALSHRLWNYEENESKGWLALQGKYSGDLRYYAKTFAYRFLVCLGTARVLEREAMFIDAKVASDEDFDFLKALKLTISVWTDTDLFDHLGYDKAQAVDHFFKDELIAMADSFFDKQDDVMSYSQFSRLVSAKRHPYVDVFKFFDGLHASEPRHRHDRLVCSHLVLIATLNSFGYGFQQTSDQNVLEVIRRINDHRVLENLRDMIARMRLEDEPAFRRLVDLFDKTARKAGPRQDAELGSIDVRKSGRSN